MTLEERLERGEIVTFSPCPFPLPEADVRQFLYDQKVKNSLHKNISFQPQRALATGYLWKSEAEERRLTSLFKSFTEQASAWLGYLLPRYAASWRLDRASFSPEEEATRKLRHTARNDLLHLD